MEVLNQVASNLGRNKLRSILTMAGIAWGVASIVLIVAMGDGFKDGQRRNTAALGENIVIVFGGRTELQAGGQRAGRRIRPTYADLQGIRSEAYEVLKAAPELQNQVNATSPYNSGSFSTLGVEPVYIQLRNVPVEQGRFFDDADDRESRRVCVIGFNVRKQLFGSRPSLLGTQVLLNGLPYSIIGISPNKEQNSSYNGRDVDKIFVPYSTMLRDMPPKDSWYLPGMLNDIIYTPVSLERWNAAQKQVRRIMGRNHGFDPADLGAVRMWDTIESAGLVAAIFDSMTAFLGVIAFITLTLGGVGVMNIMLVSVTERTREIGLRKALGARRRTILIDFLAEGLILALASGAAGWLFSWGLASIVNSLPLPEMFAGLPVSRTTTAWAFAALTVVALGSSFWPAWRAASLTPVEALRYER
jgi:putative ABC transport system permease protein